MRVSPVRSGQFPQTVSLGLVGPESFYALFDNMPARIQCADPHSTLPVVLDEDETFEPQWLPPESLAAGRVLVASLCQENDLPLEPSQVISVDLSRTRSKPGEQPRPYSRSWHSDNQTSSMFTIVISSSLTTEFLTGQIPSKLLKEFKHYPLQGWKGNRDYYSHVTSVLSRFDDDLLGDLGFKITSPAPLEAAAFGERHIHRSPTNTTDEILERLFLRAVVDFQPIIG